MTDSQEPEKGRTNERANEMVRLYNNERLTMQEIGDRFGISRERVRQILSPFDLVLHHGVDKRTERRRQIREAFERIDAGETNTKEEAERLGFANAPTLRKRFRQLDLRLKPQEPAPHGTGTRYTYYRCRCELCRAAMHQLHLSRREREPPRHGTSSSYSNWGCRCARCKEAQCAYQRKRRNAKRL